jgi:hypothetical protein
MATHERQVIRSLVEQVELTAHGRNLSVGVVCHAALSIYQIRVILRQHSAEDHAEFSRRLDELSLAIVCNMAR